MAYVLILLCYRAVSSHARGANIRNSCRFCGGALKKKWHGSGTISSGLSGTAMMVGGSFPGSRALINDPITIVSHT